MSQRWLRKINEPKMRRRFARALKASFVLENSREKPFVRQAEILQSAKELAQSGAKLVRLEFPQTEMQVYGHTAIIYTTYLYELENKQGSLKRKKRHE